MKKITLLIFMQVFLYGNFMYDSSYIKNRCYEKIVIDWDKNLTEKDKFVIHTEAFSIHLYNSLNNVFWFKAVDKMEVRNRGKYYYFISKKNIDCNNFKNLVKNIINFTLKLTSHNKYKFVYIDNLSTNEKKWVLDKSYETIYDNFKIKENRTTPNYIINITNKQIKSAKKIVYNNRDAKLVKINIVYSSKNVQDKLKTLSDLSKKLNSYGINELFTLHNFEWVYFYKDNSKELIKKLNSFIDDFLKEHKKIKKMYISEKFLNREKEFVKNNFFDISSYLK